MGPPRPDTPGWGRLLGVGLARGVLVVLVSLVGWSLAPVALGWTPRVVVSGSMEPAIAVGDVVVTRPLPASGPSVGQVLTARDPGHPGRTRTHRMVRRDRGGGIVTRGDANRAVDSVTVTDRDVLGVGVLRVPLVGLPVVWARSHDRARPGLLLVLLAGCVLAGSADDGTGRGSGRGHRRRGDGRAGRPRRPADGARRGGAVALAAALAVAALGSPAAAGFGAVTSTSLSLAAARSFTGYRDAVAVDRPRSWWRLRETSGTTVADSSGRGANGALAGPGTATWGRTGPLVSEPADTALAVADAGVTAVSDVSSPSSFSVEAWIRTTSSAGGRILGFGDGSGATASKVVDRQLYLGSDGRCYLVVGAARTTVTSAARLDDGRWHHLVGTFGSSGSGGGTMVLYVDGTAQGSATASPQGFKGYWRAGREPLPGWPGQPAASFTGTLDELAVYDDALTAARVRAHHLAATG